MMMALDRELNKLAPPLCFNSIDRHLGNPVGSARNDIVSSVLKLTHERPSEQFPTVVGEWFWHGFSNKSQVVSGDKSETARYRNN